MLSVLPWTNYSVTATGSHFLCSLSTSVFRVSSGESFSHMAYLATGTCNDTMECDLSDGNVSVRGNLVACGSRVIGVPVSSLRIRAPPTVTAATVSIENSTIAVELVDVKLSRPFTITKSNVDIILTGTSEITSSDGYAAVDCRDWSNLTFSSRSGGSLAVQGGSDSAGIGTGRNSVCHTLKFVNGTYRATGGENGAGVGASGESFVEHLAILNGSVTAHGGTNGAGIGSSIGTLRIEGGAGDTCAGIQGESVSVSGAVLFAFGDAPIEATNVVIGGKVDITCRSRMFQPCVKGESIVIGIGSIRISAESKFVARAPISVDRGSMLWIEYAEESTPEGLDGIPSLHFGQLALNLQGVVKIKYFPLSDVSLAREGDFNSSAMVGLLVSLYSSGLHSVSYRKDGRFDIPMCINDTMSTFDAIGDAEMFIPLVGDCAATPSESAAFTSFFRPHGHFFRSAIFCFFMPL
jgi:hypothetical protein